VTIKGYLLACLLALQGVSCEQVHNAQDQR